MACGQSLLICSSTMHQEFNDYFDPKDVEDSKDIKDGSLGYLHLCF